MRQINLHKLADDASFNRFHRLVLFWCALIIVFDGYDLAVIGIALPSIMKNMGVEVALTSPEEFGRLLESEIARWGRLVRKLKLRAE